MGKLFGTDGVRGLANAYPLTGEMAYKIAQYGALRLLSNFPNKKKVIYVGKDTRISGDMLENAVAAGISSAGVDVSLLGIVPTPAVAFITKESQGLGGIVISASHNPFQDNGIKIFGAEGFKIPDAIEEGIEADIASNFKPKTPSGNAIGRVTKDETSIQHWFAQVKKVLCSNLKPLKIAIDCANGAISPYATKFFSELGFDVKAISVTPDGTNINHNCGSTHLSNLIHIINQEHFDVGFAFDGDADRVLAVSSKGNVIDGDFILAIAAQFLKDQNKLPGNAIVATVMSNLGLDLAMKEIGVKINKAKVGDRFVLEEMLKSKAIVGGEQSGHIIFSEYATTGDGLLTACFLLKVIQETSTSIDELSKVMNKLPQVLINVPVKNKNFQSIPQVQQEIQNAENSLKGEGRILVRASGTENLIRVMAEGRCESELKIIVEKIVKIISIYLC